MDKETNPEIRMFELFGVVLAFVTHEPFEARVYPDEQFVHAVVEHAVHHEPQAWQAGTFVAYPHKQVTQKVVALCVKHPVIPVPVMHDPFVNKYWPEAQPPVHEVPVAEQAVAAPPPAGTVYPYKAWVQFVAEV